MLRKVAVVPCLAGWLMTLSPAAFAQLGTQQPAEPPPRTGTISAARDREAPEVRATQALESVERARRIALDQLSALGGRAAQRSQSLAKLPIDQFFQELGRRPPVGPTANVRPSRQQVESDVPIPSVNFSNFGGPTIDHPGVVLLLARRKGSREFDVHCTGTLVRQNVILTAAHCVCHSDDPVSDHPTAELCLKGKGNALNPSKLLQSDQWLAFFQYMGARQIAAVEISDQYQFNENAVRGDAAVLVLKQPVTAINPTIYPTESSDPPIWKSGVLVGFGFARRPDAPSPSVLQELIAPGLKTSGRVTYEPCDGVKYLEAVSSLCFTFNPGPTGSDSTMCSGDSGGPSMNAQVEPPEIGISSGRRGENCAKPGLAAFQMSTAHTSHRRWLDSVVTRYTIPGSKPTPGRWPAFGDGFSLTDVFDYPEPFAMFNEKRAYIANKRVKWSKPGIFLATINSTEDIYEFQVKDVRGNTLCEGIFASRAKKAEAEERVTKPRMKVDYCWANIPVNQQFFVTAQGTPDQTKWRRPQFAQWVITRHPDATGFEAIDPDNL